MAKREIRACEASDDVSAIIERGSVVDVELKKLDAEDKGIKAKLVEIAGKQMDELELSLKIVGKTASVVISGVERVELNTESESFAKVKEAVKLGLLDGIVSRKIGIVIAESDIEKASEELRKLGINSVVTETFKIEDDSVCTNTEKPFVGSVQVGEAIKEFAKCIRRGVASFRVKYDR